MPLHHILVPNSKRIFTCHAYKSGRYGNRTHDLMHAKHARYQLRQAPVHFYVSPRHFFIFLILTIVYKLTTYQLLQIIFQFTHTNFKLLGIINVI